MTKLLQISIKKKELPSKKMAADIFEAASTDVSFVTFTSCKIPLPALVLLLLPRDESAFPVVALLLDDALAGDDNNDDGDCRE